MVPILVLLTFAAFIGIGLLLERRRAVEEGASREAALPAALDLATVSGNRASFFLHPGHVWVRLLPDGLASIGASDFAANFAGSLAEVALPGEGAVLRQGDPAWTLVSNLRRRLTQTMPLDGEVVSVNRDFAARPTSAGREPGEDAWILRVRPARLNEGLRSMFGGALAETWKEVAELRLNAMLSPALGRVANDGGVWAANFGDQLNDEDWLALRRDLFPSIESAKAGGAGSATN